MYYHDTNIIEAAKNGKCVRDPTVSFKMICRQVILKKKNNNGETLKCNTTTHIPGQWRHTVTNTAKQPTMSTNSIIKEVCLIN